MVEDFHHAIVIVHAVVSPFGKRHTASCYLHRAGGDSCASNLDFAATAGFVFARQREFVFLGNLFCHGLGGVVEFVVAILVGKGIITHLLSQPVAERLHHGEDDTTCLCLDGVTLDVVEPAVGVCFLVVVQTVEVHHLQQSGLLERLFGDVAEAYARRVAEVFDVHFELLSLH